MLWPLDVTVPLFTGMLKFGALERVTIPLERETTPEAVTVNCPPLVATMTRGALESCTIPDDAETMGTLKLGALLQGFVAAVDVTMPEEIVASRPAEEVTGP
jgi:hypothetical protein